MDTKYRKDIDLDFLQYCNEIDLQILARYMTHDKDGDKRSTCGLLEDKKFKSYVDKPNQHKLCWKLIAAEFQHFGGDTIVNHFRGTGVVYKEILTDVCEKLNVKFNPKKSTYEIENKLLEKLMSDSWEKMNIKQKEELLRDIGIDNDSATLFDLLATLQKSGASYIVSTIIASSMTEAFASGAFTLVASNSAARGLSILAGPIGIAVATLLTVPAISGAAYRVTIPCVCQIAYMRRAYEKQERF